MLRRRSSSRASSAGSLPPARVHNVLAPLDVALVSVVSLNTYGLILAGILLAA